MIKTGTYAYIKGTNIEVGIRRVSIDPNNPYAQCVFRYGRRKFKKNKSKVNPIKQILQKIPLHCLTLQCDFDLRRGRLKHNFTHTTLELPMPRKEGLFDEQHDADLYDIYPCGSKFMHIMKGPAAEHVFDLLSQTPKLYVFGLQELKLPVKIFDTQSGVCTFNTTPKWMAHVSVLRRTCTMAHLGKHTNRWPHAVVSPYMNTTPAEIGFLQGTGMQVSLLIQDERISYYKVNADALIAFWIPNELVTTETQCIEQGHAGDVKPLEKDIYLHGLPTKFRAYTNNGITYAGIVHEKKLHCWPVKQEYISNSIHPELEYLKQFRFNDVLTWRCDHKRRTQHQRAYPIAIA